MLRTYTLGPINNVRIWHGGTPTKHSLVYACFNRCVIFDEIDLKIIAANSANSDSRLACNKRLVRWGVSVLSVMAFGFFINAVCSLVTIDSDVAYSFVAVQVNVIIVVKLSTDSTICFSRTFCTADMQATALMFRFVFILALPSKFADVRILVEMIRMPFDINLAC